MASLDILCFTPLNFKNKIMKIEHKKMYCGPSKILKNISWRINMPKIFYDPCKNPPPPLLETKCMVPKIRGGMKNCFYFSLFFIKKNICPLKAVTGSCSVKEVF